MTKKTKRASRAWAMNRPTVRRLPSVQVSINGGAGFMSATLPIGGSGLSPEALGALPAFLRGPRSLRRTAGRGK